MKTENLKTVAQYARMMGVTPKTIYLKIKSGEINCIQIGNIKLIKLK